MNLSELEFERENFKIQNKTRYSYLIKKGRIK